MDLRQRRFAAAWDSYAAKVLPAGAGAVQVQETRRAFYAGGAVLFATLVRVISDDAEPTEDDLRAVDALVVEFQEHARLVREGGR